MIRSYRKINTAMPELNQVQENIEQTFRLVLGSEVVNGQILRDIVLSTASTNLVEHKLDREPQGYIVIRKNAPADIYDTKSTKVSEQNFLLLESTANVTVDLWVF